MAWYREVAVWLLITALLFFLIAVIGFELDRPSSTKRWYWGFFVIALLLVLVAVAYDVITKGKECGTEPKVLASCEESE